MANHSNSKPVRAVAPVVVAHYDQIGGGTNKGLVAVAVLAAIIFNGAVLFILFLSPNPASAQPPMESIKVDVTVQPEPADEGKVSDPLVTSEIDPAAQVPSQDINYNLD